MTAILPKRPQLSALVEATAVAALHPGAGLLDDVAAFLARFVAYPSPAAHVAHALWVAHTHLMDAWESTARIAFLSPEPGSGKTSALEVSELLVPRPVEAVNVTPAYLFRKLGSSGQRPTILYDEIGTVFGPKAKDNEEIRGLLNAEHRRGAVAGRCVVRGKLVETEEICRTTRGRTPPHLSRFLGSHDQSNAANAGRPSHYPDDLPKGYQTAPRGHAFLQPDPGPRPP